MALLFPFTGIIQLIIYLSVRGAWALILLISGLASLDSDWGAGNETSQFCLIVDAAVMILYSALLIPLLWSPAHTILENKNFSLDGNLYNLLLNAGGQRQPYKRLYLGLFAHVLYRIYCIIICAISMYHFTANVPRVCFSLDARIVLLLFFFLFPLLAQRQLHVLAHGYSWL